MAKERERERARERKRHHKNPGGRADDAAHFMGENEEKPDFSQSPSVEQPNVTDKSQSASVFPKKICRCLSGGATE
jgi:hypothetical protein